MACRRACRDIGGARMSDVCARVCGVCGVVVCARDHAHSETATSASSGVSRVTPCERRVAREGVIDWV